MGKFEISVIGIMALLLALLVYVICFTSRSNCISLCRSTWFSEQQVSYQDRVECYRECMDVDD